MGGGDLEQVSPHRARLDTACESGDVRFASLYLYNS